MYANERTLKFFGQCHVHPQDGFSSKSLLKIFRFNLTGLQTYSNNENYEPALVKQDVLEFMHGRTSKSTRVLRNFAIELLTR